MAFYHKGIVVNGFMFCKDHGSECCPASQCTVDYRMGNNHVEGLYDVFAREIQRRSFDIDDRTPLNAYDSGAIPKRPGSEDYICGKHRKKKCASCFDWVSMIRGEVEGEGPQETWSEKRKKYLERINRN